MPDHAFDAGLVKQVGAVFDFQIDAVIAVGQHQREVELCGSALGQHRFDLKSLQPDKREQLIAIAPVEHHLEERRVTRAPRGLECAHHLVEGRRAMNIKIKTVFLHAKQQLAEAQVSVKLRSQHMRMQQKADDRLQFRTIPIGERDAQEGCRLVPCSDRAGRSAPWQRS